MEKYGLLRNQRELGAQRYLRHAGYILTVDRNASLADVIQAVQQLHNRGFARAGAAHLILAAPVKNDLVLCHFGCRHQLILRNDLAYLIDPIRLCEGAARLQVQYRASAVRFGVKMTVWIRFVQIKSPPRRLPLFSPGKMKG